MLCTLIGAIILSINIQVGLNMHLYDDIGDASSSLWGSTSSHEIREAFDFLNDGKSNAWADQIVEENQDEQEDEEEEQGRGPNVVKFVLMSRSGAKAQGPLTTIAIPEDSEMVVKMRNRWE